MALFNLVIVATLGVLIIWAAQHFGWVHFEANPGPWIFPLGLGIALLVLIVIGLGSIGLRSMVNPLDDLLRAADRVGRGDYSVRVLERGNSELRTLARAINTMASRLHDLDEQRRNLLADATHELRNPLTVIQGNLEGMLDGMYPADQDSLRLLLDETKILSRLVEDLRTLALVDSGSLRLKKEPTDLAVLMSETASIFRPQAAAAGVTLRVAADADMPNVDLDPGRIQQVFANLITNALRYTPSGGVIKLGSFRRDGQAELTVQDTGPGIGAGDLAHIFERFYKSADSGGMGLGLSIARDLVQAHGGTIRAENLPGQGTIIRISLPLESK
jgi:signal transduction histidine kinase